MTSLLMTYLLMTSLLMTILITAGDIKEGFTGALSEDTKSLLQTDNFIYVYIFTPITIRIKYLHKQHVLLLAAFPEEETDIL